MVNRRQFLFYFSSVFTAYSFRKQITLTTIKPAHSAGDDTAILQAALDGGGRITLEKNRVYRVSANLGERAALYIKSNTFLDLSGATLELAPNQRCSLLAQRGGAGRQQNITIANGTIIGNGKQQPSDYVYSIGITPTLYLIDCDNLVLRNLKMRDTYMYAVFSHGEGGYIDNLDIKDAIGGGVLLEGNNWKIDNVRVKDVSFFEPINTQGNPFIVSLNDSTIGKIYCENFGFGVKFQDGCNNLTIESIVALGGPNNDDFLVKIQGKKDSSNDRPNRNIKIGNIVAKNGPNSGLYIYYSDNVEISSYYGDKNGLRPNLSNKNRADILILDSDRIHFKSMEVKNYHRYGLWLHGNTGIVEVDAVDFQTDDGEDVPVMVRGGTAVLEGTLYSS